MSSSLTTKTDGSLFASSASSAGAEPTDDTEMIAHLTFFGVVLWRETRERTPTEEECRRILRVVLAPLAGGTSAPPR
ncbi:MAG: hypothetical protein QOG79_7296 [Mycobacterium sp.]|jgi:hypothetical protein|nr:hypothetical protein [Mycobacterium sp.]